MVSLNKKKVHMIGIGGIGMSGLALILARMGCAVTGSDIEKNNLTDKLKKHGVKITIGHRASNIKESDFVVYSSSIRTDNPEVVEAKAGKFPLIPRIELLKMVMDGYKRIIAVTGTHGKTTITAMASLMLEKAGFSPTVLIGGESPHFSGNAKLGKGDTLVAEVDESDGRFVILKPTHVLIPNLEKEHLEHYRNEEHLMNAFRRFFDRQPASCRLFYRLEDRNLGILAGSFRGKKSSFGLSKKADLCIKNIKTDILKTSFECVYKKKELGRFRIGVPGIHNAMNALAVILLGADLGIEIDVIAAALSEYRSVKRRFEVIGDVNGIRVVEDYAHHPTEIKATIAAACSFRPKRLITVFQPHRYTRTKSFYREFSNSFEGSDRVILTEIYSASEKKIKNVSAKNIYDIMIKNNFASVELLEKQKIASYLRKEAKPGDMILVLGAGDIGKIAHEVFGKNKK